MFSLSATFHTTSSWHPILYSPHPSRYTNQSMRTIVCAHLPRFSNAYFLIFLLSPIHLHIWIKSKKETHSLLSMFFLKSTQALLLSTCRRTIFRNRHFPLRPRIASSGRASPERSMASTNTSRPQPAREIVMNAIRGTGIHLAPLPPASDAA